MRNVLQVVALLAALPLAARADALPPGAQAQIDAANARFGPAVLRHDAAAIAGDYLVDGVFVSSAGLSLRGRTAIQAYYAHRLSHLHGVAAVSCATQRIAYDGASILEEGSCTFTVHRDRLRTSASRGHFLTIWRPDRDGRWRIAVNVSG